MNVLFIFTSSLFFLWILRELFYWLAVWQENNYRVDLFFASQKKKSKKNKLTLAAFFISKLLLILLYFLIIFHDDYLVLYEYIIICFYLLQAFFILREAYNSRLKKPLITLRVTVIIFLTLVTVLSIFAIPLVDRFFWLIFIDLITPLIVGFYVVIFSVPIEIYNDWLVEKAGRKIRKHPKLLVIAVTGSVGKSLTKDYIASVLQHKFNVVKTEGKDNNLTGVSRTILKKIEPNSQIFVAEISAYKQGEIKMLSQLIRPEIGVLTAINNQHVSLFKSLENIIKTNFELVEALPKNGICLFNGDNKNTLALYKKSKKTKVMYHSTKILPESNNQKNEIVAFNIVHKQKRASFNIFLNGKTIPLNLNSNHIDRVLPAIYLASYLGMTEKEIRHAVALLK